MKALLSLPSSWVHKCTIIVLGFIFCEKMVNFSIFSTIYALLSTIYFDSNWYNFDMVVRNSNFTFIDLFCGIGGFRYALEEINGKCLFSSDIDKNCRDVYLANFGELPKGDITKINIMDIPRHDILCAGFPCQSFSVAGKQRGFDDARGKLIFNVLNIIKIKKPKVIFLENVKQLYYHNNKQTLKIIVDNLNNLGYKTEYAILNAKDFGVPQNRERIIIIASKTRKFDFSKVIKKRNLNTIRDILDNRPNSEYAIMPKKDYVILDKKYWKKQTSGLIFCGYIKAPIRKKGTRPKTEYLSRVHRQPNRIYHIDGTHPTIPSQESSGRFWIYDGKIVRKITQKEILALQGFPKTFKLLDSKSSVCSQIGNSVVIPLISQIGKAINNQKLV